MPVHSSLRYREEDEDETVEEKPGHNVFVTTFLLIFLAEFGDKTQIAVAGLGSTSAASAVWVGATLALACTSILGVIAGRKLLHKLPLRWIHRISGTFFLLLAVFALSKLLRYSEKKNSAIFGRRPQQFASVLQGDVGNFYATQHAGNFLHPALIIQWLNRAQCHTIAR